MKNQVSPKSLIEVTLFCLLVVLLSFTPIGYIPFGVFKITTIHMPVIIASVLLGAKKGAIVGFMFGLTSFISNTFVSPTVTSFVFSPFYESSIAKGNFWSLVICFLPRILVGVVPHYVYNIIKKINTKKEKLALSLAGIAGSITNTLLIMSMIYIFFGEQYASVKAVSKDELILIIISTIFINGIVEAVSSAIIIVPICKTLKRHIR